MAVTDRVDGDSSITISTDSNEPDGDQTVLCFHGRAGAKAVVALDAGVDVDAALELVDSIEAEVASHVQGLRVDRKPVAVRDLGAGHE